MGRVQIIAPAAGSSGDAKGPTVVGAPYTESATFLLNPPPDRAAPSVTVKPSFKLAEGDCIGITALGAGTLYGGAVIHYSAIYTGGNSGAIERMQIRVNADGVTVGVSGNFSGSNAIVTVTFYRYSQM